MRGTKVKVLKKAYLVAVKFIGEKPTQKYWRSFKRSYKEGRLDRLGRVI